MRLKELRTQKGVTQKAVANAIVCSVNNYARYTAGGGPVTTLVRAQRC